MADSNQFKVGRLCRLKRSVWCDVHIFQRKVHPQFVIILKLLDTIVGQAKGRSYFVYLCEDMVETELFNSDLMVAEKSLFRSKRSKRRV